MARRLPPSRRQDLLGLATFVALGLPDGMLGTAWPSMRQSLHAAVGALGLVLLAYTVGAIGVSTLVGRAIRRLGVAGLMALGTTVAVAAAAGIAAAPLLAVVIGAGLVFGVAGGTLDGGLNVAVGTSGRGRFLNLLHGFYGVGTMIGPLVVTAAILISSWRAAYVVLVVFDVLLVGLWLGSRRAGAAPATEEAPATDEAQGTEEAPATEKAGPDTGQVPRPEPAVRPEREAGRQSGPGRGPVALGLAVFFLYTGLEVAAGQWETTFTRGHLHFSTAAAGLATFGYWAALTAVRLGLGALPKPPGPAAVVRAGTFAAVLAAAVIWWEPSSWAVVVGFVVLGAALAGVFPALVSLTPARVGPEAAPHVIAWQIGAATAGGAALSALVGLLIQGSGLQVLGPSLTVLAVILLAAELVLRRSGGTGVRIEG